MSRALVALALATQIPFRAWADEDSRVIETAWELIDERDNGPHRPDTQGRTMGG